ncbi:MAG: helix-hairpin-helix domain-containing protein [Desulfurivibrio sp.]|nr:helix-hairpin-helix domain-containing protein [Desulfurivibrio sp.]
MNSATTATPDSRRSGLLLLLLGLGLWLTSLQPWSWLATPPGPAACAHIYRWQTPVDAPAGVYRLSRAVAEDQVPGAGRRCPEVLPSPAAGPAYLALFNFSPLPVNRAERQTLTALPGIGPVLAARLVEYRQRHGSFTTIDELAAVSGIGPVTLEGLRPLVTL